MQQVWKSFLAEYYIYESYVSSQKEETISM